MQLKVGKQSGSKSSKDERRREREGRK